MNKKVFSLVMFFIILLSLIPDAGVTALADSQKPISYINAEGIPENCTEYNIVTDQTTWNTGWYIVNGDDITISDRITVSGNVNLILMDGKKLKANGGITVSAGTPSNSLTIYGQGKGNGILEAKVTDDTGNAGIGGLRKNGCGSVTINGGYVVAMGSSKKDSPLYAAAGIGGGSGGSGGLVTVNGGTVLADGGHYIYDGHKWGAGIGAGYGGESPGILYVCNNNLLVKAGSGSIAGLNDIIGYSSSTNLQEDGHLVRKDRVFISPVQEYQESLVIGHPIVWAGTIKMPICSTFNMPIDVVFIVACYSTNGKMLGLSMTNKTVTEDMILIDIEYPGINPNENDIVCKIMALDSSGLFPFCKCSNIKSD